MDRLIVKDLAVRNIIGVDRWERIKRQPLLIQVEAYSYVGKSGLHDELGESINYSSIAKHVQAYAEATSFKSIEALAAGILLDCLTSFPIHLMTVTVQKPRALLHADCAAVHLTRGPEHITQLLEAVEQARRKDFSCPVLPDPKSLPSCFVDSLAETQKIRQDVIFVKNLRLSCIIGVNPWEREEDQDVIVNLALHVHFNTSTLLNDQVPRTHNYRTITRLISKYVRESSFKTVEALVMGIANLLLIDCFVPKVTVKVEKPSALLFASSAGVEVTRTKADLMLETGVSNTKVTTRLPKYRETAYIAIGSNMGNRMQNIVNALSRLLLADVSIEDTSFLYETSPMYVTDQANFLNACIKITTSLSPHNLLKSLKQIENDLGRDFAQIRNGPRPIDLDILFYNSIELNTVELTIPHPRIAERLFVLVPLCDIAPNLEHASHFRTVKQLLALLQHREVNSDRIWRVICVRDSIWRVQERTFLMGILNVTPDSFSDGGKFVDLNIALKHTAQMVKNGADIIDVGGQSTRPNADDVGDETEMERVIPVIKALREQFPDLPISIDTFRASVAKAAIEAGADFINDVSGGTRDPEMLQVMGSSHLPICLMHMRGDSKTMMGLTDYEGDVVSSVANTFKSLVQNALDAGVWRWNIILDPGIGFAKTVDQNFDLLKGIRELVNSSAQLNGFAVLVGPSRKGFIGSTIQQDDASKRVWGTAAACTASVAAGASILRVHDVSEMKDVVLVADKCFK